MDKNVDMNRRDFTTKTAAVGTLGATGLVTSSLSSQESSSGPLTNEIYELRQYEVAFFDNKANLMSHLNDVLLPAMKEAGANHTFLFKEQGDAEPTKFWVMISYPSLDIYQICQTAISTPKFVEASADHSAAGKSYNRYSSSLLSAFDGIPKMRLPADNHALFELRIYEGVNEDAVRRKVMMFDDEELPLFDEVGLNSIFFGKMLIGPYMPCLVYMLGFEDMDDRAAAWTRFGKHPDWIEMLNKPIYKDTVSNIRKVFLEKIGA